MDFVIFYFGGITLLLRTFQGMTLPALNVEFPAVPGTSDLPFFDMAIRQRSAPVKAMVRHRVKLAFQVE